MSRFALPPRGGHQMTCGDTVWAADLIPRQVQYGVPLFLRF